ncbi:MAG: hypothetical protein ACJAZA_000750 [Shewanella psychromarinicola]
MIQEGIAVDPLLARAGWNLAMLVWCGRSATTLVAAGHILNTLLSRNALRSIAARNRNRISAKNSIAKRWLDDGGDRVDAVYNVVVIVMIFYNGRMRSVVQFSLPLFCSPKKGIYQLDNSALHSFGGLDNCARILVK